MRIRLGKLRRACTWFVKSPQRLHYWYRSHFIPAAVIKKSDCVDYLTDLLDRIDLPLVRMCEVKEARDPCYYIRHDVDYDIDFAIRIARLEAKHGLASTYFLLTPAAYDHEPENYYGSIVDGRIHHHPRLIDKCKRLIELGHDVGFHNDLVALALKTGVSPAEILEREMTYFEHHGIRLRGSASHGNPLARKLSFNNKEIFEGSFVKRSGVIQEGYDPGRTISYNGHQVTLHSLRMEDFGLEYEAYSLPRDSRLSESGGFWGGRIAGQQLPKEIWQDHFDIDEFRKMIGLATAANGVKAFSVMTHPRHWDAK